MNLKLIRTRNGESGTTGKIFNGLKYKYSTLELPWKDNEPDISCIPEGVYTCKRIYSPKFGNVFEITNVKDRENILLHVGNFLKDTHGCVLIGNESAMIGDEYMITNSRTYFNEFMLDLKDVNEFKLEITKE